ncbi:MAG: hypothetical protein EAZ82_12250 [Verrucomicrobia bacterium]|nr:MAG: hypothetical protein EAZ82_12250 [Verrucomicrobiota bacterium]
MVGLCGGRWHLMPKNLLLRQPADEPRWERCSRDFHVESLVIGVLGRVDSCHPGMFAGQIGDGFSELETSWRAYRRGIFFAG